MLSPRGYGPLYALEIFATGCFATRRRSCTWSRWWRTSLLLGEGPIYAVTLGAQLALLAAAALARLIPAGPAAARPLLRRSSPLRSPPASGIGSAAACRGPGRRPRERGDRRASPRWADVVIAVARAC